MMKLVQFGLLVGTLLSFIEQAFGDSSVGVITPPHPSDLTFVTLDHDDLDVIECGGINEIYDRDSYIRVQLHIANVDVEDVTEVNLLIPGFDVDYHGDEGMSEISEVKFNGHNVGVMRGANEVWHLNSFQLGLNMINFNAENEIEIHVDTKNQGLCTIIDWVAVEFEVADGTPEDEDRPVESDNACNNVEVAIRFDNPTPTECNVQASLMDLSNNFVTSYTNRQEVCAAANVGEAIVTFDGMQINDASNYGPFQVMGVLITCDNGSQYIKGNAHTTSEYSLHFLCPSSMPSTPPSIAPTTSPSIAPSTSPSIAPSTSPSNAPSTSPSNAPSTSPSNTPSNAPSTSPSNAPSTSPSNAPSTSPSNAPSTSPSYSVVSPQETREVPNLRSTELIWVVDHAADLDVSECGGGQNMINVGGDQWLRVTIPVGNVDRSNVAKAFLVMPVFDVDFIIPGRTYQEISHVYFNQNEGDIANGNAVQLGTLNGADMVWHLNTFELNLSDININGDNHIAIHVDVQTGSLCIKVDWMAIEFEERGGGNHVGHSDQLVSVPGRSTKDLEVMLIFESPSDTTCNIQASLFGNDGRFITSYTAREPVDSTNGYGEAEVKFSGESILESGLDGPFEVVGVLITCGNGVQYLKDIMHTTQGYQNTQFVA